ncbi:gephyrin-like [Temnothorax nylanderi]|uniref:gephyrin-like n=1 Tax=Temnothorax nylanderi TaxID=102681 RepID=UPI003A8B705E
MSEMAIRAQFVILCEPDTNNLKESEDSLDPRSNVEFEKFPEMVTYIPNTEVIGIIISTPVKIIITKTLLLTCINYEADIIFIIGDIESTERQCANEAIESVTVDRKELSTELANLMTNIEKKLEEIMRYRSRCGIRNKTLFINLLGTHEDREKCMAAISDILANTVHFIRKSENQHISLSDIASSSRNNDFPEQGKDKDANENLEKSSSLSTSSCSSLTEDINDNANNCHEDLFPMITIESAMEILFRVTVAHENSNQRNSESVKLSDAYGRISCEDIYSNCNVPPFRTSGKHGYAVLVNDGKGLRKVQDRENTFPLLSLQPGTCVWVNSGEPIPEGATAVVQVKDTKPLEESPNDDSKYIEIMIKPQHGQNIKPIGFDICYERKDIILKKFTRIGPEEIGVLAASGCKEVIVVKQLSIGVLSIGDNLQEPGESLQPGFTYDINRITLISLLKHNGYSSLDFGIVNDKLSPIREKIKEALNRVDILVTTGSINDKDLLKYILMNYFEADVHFGNVNMKPGKSTTLASCKIKSKINYETKYFLCLSGNPMSALTAAHLFLLPFVNKLHCNANTEPAAISTQIDASFLTSSLHHRPRLAWTCLRFNEESIAKAFNMGNFYKDRLCNMVGSNALLVLPERKQKLLSSTENIPALLIDYPKNFD